VRRLVLTTNFDDNSSLRQRLSFALWNHLAPEHIQIRSFNAVVYLDGQYLGLYQVTDHVDDDLLRAAGLAAGVNMYKARTHAANFRSTDDKGKQKTALRAGYTKEEGFPEDGAEGAYDDLEALVDWIIHATPEDFFAEYDQRLARRDFEDWLVFTHLIAAGDTTNKNCYLIHDPRPDAPDSRWRFVPWDFNTSFGQGFATQRLPAEKFELDAQAKRNLLFERQLKDPRLRESILARYREVLAGPWTVDDLIASLDTWSAEIEGAALRDEVKWSEAYQAYWVQQRKDFNRNTYREEIEYLRQWIRTRWAFIGANL
jgi:spore coat protein CotH